MCGTEVGYLAFGRFVEHAGCATPLPHRGGLPRCCHCGGTLYLAPMEGSLPVADRGLLDRMLAEEAGRRPTRRRRAGRPVGRGARRRVAVRSPGPSPSARQTIWQACASGSPTFLPTWVGSGLEPGAGDRDWRYEVMG